MCCCCPLEDSVPELATSQQHTTAEGFRKLFRNSRRRHGETFTQFRNRLRYYSQNWFHMEGACERFENLADLVLREQLQNACDFHLGPIVEAKPSDLEQMFPNYDKIIKNYTEDLQTSQCVLLVAGEMGSGKSSLVNLLLGKQLMPTSDLRCTAAIVEISYGASPQAIAHYRDDSSGRAKTPILFKPDSLENLESFLKKLELVITARDEETDESPFEKVQLQWPLEMLEVSHL
ncbi:unnamed protein product [Candidula unifasciata]|uniref:Dynamin N-terminal domain-containing protein n=1 Tax=Candidula unifasciata TaxID=100452 RepID=A0A8S3YTG0_9EUPU|nr:unnamed protein product [Candidula unifasciata]